MATKNEKKRVWVDSDDEVEEEKEDVSTIKRRKRFTKLHGSQESWTKVKESDDDDVGRVASKYVSDKEFTVRRLPSPPSVKGKAKTTTLVFHPTRPNLYVAADMSGGVRVLMTSSVLSSASISSLPVRSCEFEPVSSAKSVLLAGRRPFYYVYDLSSQKYTRHPSPLRASPKASLESFALSKQYIAFLGNDGRISLCCARTRRWIRDVRINGSVRSVCFSPNGNDMLAVGSEGEVYRFDLRKTFQCVERHKDEGNLGGTLVRYTPNGTGYVVGSTSGVLNTYTLTDEDSTTSSSSSDDWTRRTDRTPTYSVMNLTTAIDHCALSHSNKAGIGVIASGRERDALRLFNISNGSVFSAWPTINTPLGHVNSVGFDCTGKLLGIGNRQGKVLLYELGGEMW